MSDLDHTLTIQLLVAWAGESGDPPRLGWWRTDMVSEYGGGDLFKRLLPNTWQWASTAPGGSWKRGLLGPVYQSSQPGVMVKPSGLVGSIQFLE